MRRSESRARQHRNGGLGHHGHVDADRVALAHAQTLEQVGALAHLRQQLRVGDATDVLGVVTLEQNSNFVAVAGVYVPVDAVVGNLRGTTHRRMKKKK